MDRTARDDASREQLCVPSATRHLASLRARLHRFLHGLSVPDSVVHDVVLAVHEATVNGMMHGNGLDESKSVTVTITATSGSIAVEVQDEGTGFDWGPWLRRARGAGTPPEAPSGRGVLVMARLMDAISFNESGNVVRMTKRRHA